MVFLCWKRPSPEDQKACIDKCGGSFNYDPKYRTASSKPLSSLQSNQDLSKDGFLLNHSRVLLGSGLNTYTIGKTALQNWRHFRMNWTFVQPNTRIETGTKFCVCVKEFLPWLIMPLQVAYVNDAGKASFGFGSGTLQGHLLNPAIQSGKRSCATVLAFETGIDQRILLNPSRSCAEKKTAMISGTGMGTWIASSCGMWYERGILFGSYSRNEMRSTGSWVVSWIRYVIVQIYVTRQSKV